MYRLSKALILRCLPGFHHRLRRRFHFRRRHLPPDVTDDPAVRVTDAVDRLSSLPDEPLYMILSKLDTKDAFYACVLSHRLMEFSGCLPNIILDDGYTTDHLLLDDVGKDFAQFCLRRVTRRDVAEIDLFQLTSVFNFYVSGLETVITTVAQQIVREIAISGVGMLPKHLYTNRSLQILKLTGRSLHIFVPGVVDLPNLEVLSFKEVDLECNNSMTRLFGGCPRLMELYLFHVYAVFDLDIYIPTLQKLCVKQGIQGVILHLDTPNLNDLKYRVGEAGHLNWVNKPNLLHTANLKFVTAQSYDYICRFVSRLRGVSSLRLSGLAIQIAQETPSVFETVKSLELKVDNLETVKDIVRSTPRLEVLVIRSDAQKSDQDELKRVLQCKVVFKRPKGQTLMSLCPLEPQRGYWKWNEDP